MRVQLLLLAILVLACDAGAQSAPMSGKEAHVTSYRITLDIDPASPAAQDDIYVAGGFNGWSPRDDAGRMVRLGDGRYFLNIENAPLSSLEFTFTRGSWRSQEANADGSAFPVHRIEAGEGPAGSFTVEHWRDDFPAAATTASPRVRQMGTFYSPQMNRYRRVWIYLPKGYQDSNGRYPVLYMHDGQSVFDQAISGNFDSTTMGPGEWSVDEAADAGGLPLIVVAVENGGSASRWIEYVPFDTPAKGHGEGRKYLEFIVDTIKPYVDAHYRTNPGRDATYIAGSSLGGLISFYSGLYHPDVFGKIGALSPSLWYARDVRSDIGAATVRAGVRPRYYFYAGQKELDGARSGPSDTDVLQVIEEMRSLGWGVEFSVNPDGIHRVKYWREEMPRLLNWLLGE